MLTKYEFSFQLYAGESWFGTKFINVTHQSTNSGVLKLFVLNWSQLLVFMQDTPTITINFVFTLFLIVFFLTRNLFFSIFCYLKSLFSNLQAQIFKQN